MTPNWNISETETSGTCHLEHLTKPTAGTFSGQGTFSPNPSPLSGGVGSLLSESLRDVVGRRRRLVAPAPWPPPDTAGAAGTLAVRILHQLPHEEEALRRRPLRLHQLRAGALRCRFTL